MTSALQEHWNKIYATTPVTRLGWYEAEPLPSLQLIARCAVLKHDPIIDVGSGASTLIAHLLDLGYQNLYAVDLSEVALQKAQALLADERLDRVQWLVADILDPSARLSLPQVALWHDRAVFHFLTEEQQRQAYRAAVQAVVKPGGFVVLATFALAGAPKCSGLPVQRYDVDGLREFLGEGFSLIESLDYTYHMPSGDVRPYAYARFQKA